MFDRLLVKYEAAGEVVGAVEQQIAVAKKIFEIAGIQSLAERFDIYFGIDPRKLVSGRYRFTAADIRFVKQHLALQVREFHLV